jgi:biopolymer transport protein TolQ
LISFLPSVLVRLFSHSQCRCCPGTVLNLFAQSGTMVQAVLILLLIFGQQLRNYFLQNIPTRQARSASQSFAALFRSTRDFATLAGTTLTAQSSPLAQIFSTAYQEFSQWRNSTPQATTQENHSPANLENLELTLRRAVREQMTWLERALTFLATTASTTPFIGLWYCLGDYECLSGPQYGTVATIQAVAPYCWRSSQLRSVACGYSRGDGVQPFCPPSAGPHRGYGRFLGRITVTVPLVAPRRPRVSCRRVSPCRSIVREVRSLRRSM